MGNATYSAQWLWLKPLSKQKIFVFIFPHAMIYLICRTPFKAQTAKFFSKTS